MIRRPDHFWSAGGYLFIIVEVGEERKGFLNVWEVRFYARQPNWSLPPGARILFIGCEQYLLTSASPGSSGMVGAPWWLAADPAKLSSFASFPLSTAANRSVRPSFARHSFGSAGSTSPRCVSWWSVPWYCSGGSRTALSHFFSFTCFYQVTACYCDIFYKNIWWRSKYCFWYGPYFFMKKQCY